MRQAFLKIFHNFEKQWFQKDFFITINWPFLLAFVTFWSYGWQPIIARDAVMLQAGVVIYTVCILTGYLILGLNNSSFLSSKILLSFKDFLAFIVIAAIWIAIEFFRLQEPISGDQFYYSLGAKAHEMYLVEKLQDNIFFQDMAFKNLVYSLDVLLLIIGFLILSFLNRLRTYKPLFCIAVIVITIGARFFSLEIGIGGSPHPPFQLFPIWFVTSILGISDWSLRLSQLIGLIFCSGFIYWTFRNRIGCINSLVLSIAACSIPLYMHVASMVEGSAWTTFIAVIVLTKIIFNPPKIFSSWFGVSVLICIFTLMRLTAFLLFPIFIYFYLQQFQKNNHKISLNNSLLLFTPLLLCLPFFVMSVTQGTPATYISGEAEYIAGSNLVFNRLYFALKEGIIYGTSFSAIGPFWLTLILGILFRDKYENNYLKNRVLIGLLFLIFVATFFSIRPILWGVDRYKTEYLVPFILIGVILILIKLYEWRVSRRYFLIFAFGFIVAGSLNFMRYPQYFIDPLAGKPFARQTEQFYDFRRALHEAQTAGFSKKLIFSGVTYGVMPQILSGYSLAEVTASQWNYDQYHGQMKLGKTIVDSIVAIPEVNMILLMDPDVEKNKATLIEAGWISWNNFPKDKGYEIHSVIRDNKLLK